MQQVELIVALLAVIGAVGVISERSRIALPILLVFAGMLISLIPQIPPIKLEPSTVFFIFLPPLLYLDAFNTPWRTLKSVAEFITLQAIGLVLVTVVAVAVAIHAVVPDMPWAAAFVLGAIVSPTDAVSASAISKEVKLPKRLLDVIKGESLVNDSTGLIAYQFAVAAMVTGAFSWQQAGSQFFIVGLGGIALGLLFGWILSHIRTKIENRPVEIIFSLLSPFIPYLAAEHLHVSGILAVVTAGLFLGWKAPKMVSSQTRLQANANWEIIAYILNGFSFLLMGLQLQPILETVKKYTFQDLLLWSATAAIAPILIRFIWTFATTPLYSYFKRKFQPDWNPYWKHMFVFSWSGMRGVISLAAALALPHACANGEPFPYRDLLIFLTIVVISSTLILQGITLPSLVKKIAFEPDLYDAESEERKTRLFLAREAVRRIDQYARETKLDRNDPIFQKLMNRYLEQAIAIIEPGDGDLVSNEIWQNLLAVSIVAQRELLITLRDNQDIEDEVFKLLQNELDLEEAQITLPSVSG